MNLVNQPPLLEILVALIMAIIGPLLVILLQEYFKKREVKAARKIHIKAYEGNQKIDNILDEIFQLPGVKKAVLIQNTNGGGIPKAGYPIYSSIISPQRWGRYWDKQLIDREFEELTLKVLKEGKYSLGIDDLEEGSILKTSFRTQDILFSHLEEVKLTDQGFIFISVDFYLEEKDIPIEVMDKIRININQIKNIYNSLN